MRKMVVMGGIVGICAVAFAGFEIGNGRRSVVNLTGGYEIKVPDQFEVGMAGQYTEVVTPLSAGTPRARLQVNVVPDKDIKDSIAQCRNSDSSNCEPIQVGNLTGVKKSVVLPTQLKQVEARLSDGSGKGIIVNIEGVPSGSPDGAFEVTNDSLNSLKTIAP